MVGRAKRLLECNSFSITSLLLEPPIPDITSNVFYSYLESVQSLNLLIHFQKLPSVEPPPDFDGLEGFIANHVQLHLPHVRDAVHASTLQVTGFVLHLFATLLMDLAYELNIPSYIFFASNAAFLGLMLHLLTLDEKMKLRSSDRNEVIRVPGLPAIPSHSMPEMLMNKKSPL
ncbi:hypothetical protein LUZ60_005427 [Juncus effusus]|nr:hypothetical protein LUZ60_005427 [Juncus effusus]